MRKPLSIYRYRSYEISINRLLGLYFAYPVLADATEGRLSAKSTDELRALIDASSADRPLNPWELPREKNLQTAA